MSSTALAPLKNTIALPSIRGVTVTETGLICTDEMTVEDHEKLGVGMARLRNLSSWAIGDWVNTSTLPPQEAFKAAAKVFGTTWRSAQEYGRVSKMWPQAKRNANLSWTHHQVLVAQPAARREALLARAEREQWTPGVLRLQISNLRAESAKNGAEADDSQVIIPPGSATLKLEVTWNKEVADDPELQHILRRELRNMIQRWEHVDKVVIEK